MPDLCKLFCLIVGRHPTSPSIQQASRILHQISHLSIIAPESAVDLCVAFPVFKFFLSLREVDGYCITDFLSAETVSKIYF